MGGNEHVTEIETGGGERVRDGVRQEECPGVCQRYGNAPSQALAHESHSSMVPIFYVFLGFGRMKKKAKTAGLKSGVQPRLLPHSNLHHPLLLSLSYPSVSRAPFPFPSPAVTPHPCTDPCLLSFEVCLFVLSGAGERRSGFIWVFLFWFQSLRFRRSVLSKKHGP
jgi:hypothetical protein